MDILGDGEMKTFSNYLDDAITTAAFAPSAPALAGTRKGKKRTKAWKLGNIRFMGPKGPTQMGPKGARFKTRTQPVGG